MSPSLTSIATDAVTAVADSFTSYFKKKERFNQEFFIPAAAFVMGFLAVLMAIMGPDVPRAWWGKLTGDLKLLVIALVILALVLITELSKPLVLLVRQLYSGEWPAWSWLQWRRKLPFLRQQMRWQKTVPDLFAQADASFNKMADQFAAWQTSAPPSATGKADYPVLTRSVGAYHLIAESDWRWASAQQIAGTLATPADLLGRYTLKPLQAGVPVQPEEVGALPDQRFLKRDRQLLTVEFFPGDLAEQITRGLIVTLYVRPRAEKSAPVAFPDLFIVERSDNRLVLSAPQDQISRLVALLPGGRLTLTCDAAADLRPLQAAPVVQPTDPEGQPLIIRRGQLIQREQITWAVKTAADLAELGDIFTTEADIIGKIYWPPAATPDPTLTGGCPFPRPHLVPAPKDARTEWFLIQTANGATRSRLAYRLDLSRAAAERGHGQRYTETAVAAESSAEDSTINLLVIDYASTEQARPPNAPVGDTRGVAQRHPVAKGDRVEVAFYKANTSEPFEREPLCYVHDLKAGEYAWLSVRDPERFNDQLQQAQQGGKITLNSFVGLPVLTRPLTHGDLIEPDMVTTRYFLAKDSFLIDGMYASAADVEHCCVVAEAIKEGIPIPKTAAQKAWGDKREWLALSGKASRFTVRNREGRVQDGGLGAIRRGDLVAVTMQGKNGEKLPWQLSFVRHVTVKEDQPVRIELAVPSRQKTQADSLWAQDSAVELTVTHTDNYVREDLGKLDKDIQARDRLAPISRILSASDQREEALVKEAKSLEELCDRLAKFRQELAERPWRLTPLNDPNQDAETAFWRLQEQLRSIVERWQQVRQALEERRERESARTLPDEAAEVRSTRLGRVLAAAADYPEQVYSIDTATILPRLLNVLRLEPEEGAVKDSVVLRLINTEASLNMMLLFSFWAAVWAVLGSVALLAFGGPWWMFLVVAVGGALLARVAQDAAYYQAVAYGEALKALFDLRRHKLLEAIGYQLSYPISPIEEQPHWRNLNSLYALGVAEDFPKLNKPGDQGKGG